MGTVRVAGYRFPRVAWLVLVLCAGGAVPALAGGSGAVERHTYMIRLSGASLTEHAAERVASQGLAKALGGRKQAMRAAMVSADAQAYLHQLDAARKRVVGEAASAIGRAPTPMHVYRYGGNGMALRLSASEAARMASVPGVVSVRRERIEHVLTDAGPEWIGADKLWNGEVSGVDATKGEGVVVGVIDTGINPTHPAFAAGGPDGYTITNPRGHFFGLCASGQATCNAKLIGIYDMTDEGTKGVDSVGHGSHVSGIVAGDAMMNALPGHTVSLQRFVSGVAPHANLIMYKACKAATSDNPDGGCPESDLVAAIDQAIADRVDVINYSIGGDTVDPYGLLNQGNNDAAEFFQARSAGIVVVAAAGNAGPGPDSIDEPGNSPWVIGVANATHNRRFSNSIGDFSGASGAPPTLEGVGYTAGYGPKPIVYAGDFGNALCGTGPIDYPPTGASNPFAPGTFHGEIVVCDRGVYARVEKGYNVKLAGAGGYILANAASDGESVVSDDHYLPAVHLGYTEGQQLEAWLRTSGSHMGTISGVNAVLDDSYGDILEVSSSRGPYGFSGGILKPDITAPGTNILSAARTGSGLALLTGTSMASPHVAGSAALLLSLHPSWSPSQVESALLTTALAGSVRREDAVTPGSPLDAGAGRTRVDRAAQAGLYLPLSANGYQQGDPTHGGDPAQINRPGIESESCANHCSFTRKLTDMSGGGTWQVSTEVTSGAHITVTPSAFTLSAGSTRTLTIDVDVSDPHLPGSWVDGRIVLHKTGGGNAATDTALTLAVYAAPGSQPTFREIHSDGPSGSMTFTLDDLVALPEATFTTTTLEPANVSVLNLGVDSGDKDLYNLPGDGKQYVMFPINGTSGEALPDHASSLRGRVFIAEITSTTAGQAVLYTGVDSNGDGVPERAEQACTASASQVTSARCIVDLRDAAPGAIQAWALVDIPRGSSGMTFSVTLSAAVPATGRPAGSQYDNSQGQLIVTGPGHVPANASFPLRLNWGNVRDASDQALAPGRYYGAVLVDAEPNLDGQVAYLPFALTRATGGNDVVDALEPESDRAYVIEKGETLQHQFIDVPGAGRLVLNTAYAGNQHSNLAFHVVRANFPASASSPDIAAAPAATAGSPQWTMGGSTTSASVTVPVSAGRWYVVASNTGTGKAAYTLHAQLNPTAQQALPVPGAYYNPLRSGHGIFMSQSGGLQAVYWYTYLEDGTPTWYAALAPVPDTIGGVWTAPLYSVNWNGSAVNATTVLGDLILTPIDATDFIYSWHLNGSSGSERFARIAPVGDCVTLNGNSADFDGQWYAPAQSGYGMDVLALPTLQNDTFYLYDSLGLPIWVAGAAAPFEPQTTLHMNQLHGFCPLCAFEATRAEDIGTLTVSYSSPQNGHYASDIHLLPPLSGDWQIDQPISRLTGSAACLQ